MKKRILLILLILTILAGAVGGTWWYMRRNQGWRLLARVQLAMKAEKYQNAVDLAGSYVQQNPDHWEGHYWQGMGLSRLGREQEARAAFQRALEKLTPDQKDQRVRTLLMIAETHSQPARRLAAAADSATSAERALEALEQLERATRTLLPILPEAGDLAPDVGQALGLDSMYVNTLQEHLASAARREADAAETTGDPERAAEKRKEADQREALASAARDKAIAYFLDVLRRDPRRSKPAEQLVRLCVQQGKTRLLDEVDQLVLDQEDPPPGVAASLIALRCRRAPEVRRYEAVVSGRKRLEDVLAKHPDDVACQFQRATLLVEEALLTGDPHQAQALLDEARAQCERTLNQNPRHPQTRLLLARLQIDAGQIREAREGLNALKTDFPGWAEAHFQYGRALSQEGDKELARQAMRQVVDLDPTHAMARAFLVESLIADGLTDVAMAEAAAYRIAAPRSAEALRLYVLAAMASDQQPLARTVLKKAAEEEQHWRMWLTMADLWQQRLGDANEALACYLKAENQLREEVRQAGPLADPEMRYRLGVIYQFTGRMPEALEQFRLADEAPGDRTAYRLALAMALLESGQIEESRQIAETIVSDAPRVQVLRMRLRLASGQEVTAEDLQAQDLAAGGSGLGAAVAMLRTGQAEQCAALCRELLAAGTNVEQARWLLGHALLQMGQRRQCVEEWSQLLSANPNGQWIYSMLAGVLAADRTPEEVSRTLEAIPNAKAEYVRLTEAALHARAGALDKAEAIYRSLAEGAKPLPHVRDQARYQLARLLIHGKKFDEASRELQRLEQDPQWKWRAALDRVALLALSGKRDQALELVRTLQAQHGAEAPAHRARLIGAYASLGDFDSARKLSDLWAAEDPDSPRPFLVLGGVCARTRRHAMAAEAYQHAARRQPGNISTYLQAARNHELAAQPMEALAALDSLEALGGLAAQVAALHRGSMLSRWGLHAEAVKAFDRLPDSPQDPRLRLSLGASLAAIGQNERARRVLEGIPAGTDVGREARRQLIGLDPDADKALRMLDELEKQHPHAPEWVAHRMDIHSRRREYASAAAALRRYAARLPEGSTIPDRLAVAAVDALLRADDAQAAADLAAGPHMSPRVQALGAMVRLAYGLPAAELPAPAEATPRQAIVGLCAAHLRADASAASAWSERVAELTKDPQAAATDLPSLRMRMLLDILSGRGQQAADAGPLFRSAAEDLLSANANEKEAARLLLGELALADGAGALARRLAMDALASRPASQYALLMACQADIASSEQALAAAEPKDSPAALWARMLQLRGQRKFEQSAALCEKIAARLGDDPQLALERASDLEAAGKLNEALELYLQAWRRGRSPVAANNAAYVMSGLYADDPARLAEALDLAKEAVQAAPRIAAFRETYGWLLLLNGQQQALPVLHGVLAALPNEPEVHYHLGLAESGAGNRRLARWHLRSAVSLGERMEKQGVASPAVTKAVAAARKALGSMDSDDASP